MSLWRQLARGLRVLAASRRRRSTTSPTRWRTTLELATRGAHRARALARRCAARRHARARQPDGHVASRCASYGWENAVDDVLADLRYAIRRLRSNPGLRRRQRRDAGARHRRDAPRSSAP